MARELLAIDADIPFRIFNENKDGNDDVKVDDFEMHCFPQMWGSTALGFKGMGGQAMTEANTYVFVPLTCSFQNCLVYFSSRFAYAVPYSQALMKDIQAQEMKPVSKKYKYFDAYVEEVGTQRGGE